MMAVMFVASATAFAGDSDALKAILKSKTYAEAEQLVKSTPRPARYPPGEG